MTTTTPVTAHDHAQPVARSSRAEDGPRGQGGRIRRALRATATVVTEAHRATVPF